MSCNVTIDRSGATIQASAILGDLRHRLAHRAGPPNEYELIRLGRAALGDHGVSLGYQVSIVITEKNAASAGRVRSRSL